MKKILTLLFLLQSFLFAQSFSSTSNQTTILELYTSQGCSSCPKADDWINDLKKHPKVFKEIIPLAFHVNYWDFLGWKDTFAQEKFTKRQRNYSAVWNTTSVYTPQFILNGKEYKKWFYNKNFPTLVKKEVGILKANLNHTQLDIQFNNKSNFSGRAKINIALIGFDYAIDILRGENKNRILHHNFVVEHFEQHNITLNTGINKARLYFNLKINKKNKALVVFITKKRTKEVIQATGGYL